MKTTLDLPDDLVMKIKIRAVQERRPLKTLVADLLRQGLEGPSHPALPRESDPLPEGLMINDNGFPIIRCGSNAPAARLTVEELLALEQQSLLEEDLGRAGLSH